jgi:GNAT superfamily N-acetyltransferase
MDIVELAAIRAVIGRAYADDPLSSWIFADAPSRVDACAIWYGLFVETYARCAQVTWLADDQAVCLWHTPDDPGLEWPDVPSIGGVLAALVGESGAERVGNALHPISDITPSEPHVYVNFLAVDPARQGRGAGGRAIAPALEAARAAGLGVRLESTNPRNLPFYERLGFQRHAELQLGNGPLLNSLWLPPTEPSY